MKIPFNNLYAQYLSIQKEIDSTIENVIVESGFISSKFVKEFEAGFAAALDVPHCISCGNGTDALFIALRSLNLKKGDEVITPANSWISSAEVITLAGGRVVFCDIDRDTYTLDPSKVEEAVTKKTKGIIAVHLYGQPADMTRLLTIAEDHGLWLIEDCSQAHFARQEQKYTGSMGDVGTFSFYPGKNLGAFGDAGCILTYDSKRAEFIRKFACHGSLIKGAHEMEGINSRMDGLQAAILSVKLSHIEAWTNRRRQLAGLYNEFLADIAEITLPKLRVGSTHVFHLYVIRTEKRDELRKFLADSDIGTGIHYPTALPFLPAYEYLNHSPDDFPVAFMCQNQILSLPIYPEMTEEMVGFVAHQIRQFFSK
jgi:dTDP-4-amino-4,6-dideoxygalactose transaminase